MLEYWELKHAPSEGDTESWQLKLKIPASELISFLNNLPGIIGEPAKIEENEFNFRVFIYEVKPGIFPLISDYLKEKCPIGEIYDKTKKGAFESILDDLAHSLDTLKGLNEGKEKAEEAKPEEAGPVTDKPLIKEPTETRGTAGAQSSPTTQNDQLLSYKDISDIFNVNYDPQYTFNSYVSSKAQEPIIESIKSVANNPGTAHNPLFIQAEPGTGKTHLLHAIAQHARSVNNGLNIFFIDPELFIAKMSNSFKDGSLFYAKRYFLRSDILLVDNIELFKESVIYQKQIASIFRYLLELKKQIVITSRCAKEQLSFLDAKLFELINSSFAVKIDVLDNETRLDIFRSFLKASSMKITEQQISYVATKLPANFRSMEAFIKRLKLYTSIKNDVLSNDILDKALSETVSSSTMISAKDESVPVVPALVSTPVAPVAAPEPASAPAETLVAPVAIPTPVSAPTADLVAAPEPVSAPAETLVAPVAIPTPVSAPTADPVASPDEPVSAPVETPVAPVVIPSSVATPEAVPAAPVADPAPAMVKEQPTHVASSEIAEKATTPEKSAENVISADTSMKSVNNPQTQQVSGKKTVKVGLFYPVGFYIEAVSLRDNFRNCLTAHKFNFFLDFVFLQQYTSADSPYKIFSDICLRNDAGTAIVLGFLKSNLSSSSNTPSLEEIKTHLKNDPSNKSIFFEYIDNKFAGTDKPCLQYVLDIAISKELK